MEGWQAIISILGGAMASAFAVTKMSMAQQRSTVDRFMTFLEAAVQRQENQSQRFAEAVDHLADNVREHTIMLRALAEKRGAA